MCMDTGFTATGSSRWNRDVSHKSETCSGWGRCWMGKGTHALHDPSVVDENVLRFPTLDQ